MNTEGGCGGEGCVVGNEGGKWMEGSRRDKQVLDFLELPDTNTALSASFNNTRDTDGEVWEGRGEELGGRGAIYERCSKYRA